MTTLTRSGDKQLDEQLENWLAWDRNPKTLAEINNLIKLQDWNTLRLRLCNRIAFGTAGLRACMRAGFDSMNDLIVVQTAQGLCDYIGEVYPDKEMHQKRGIVLGYDGRYNSKRFAELTAAVFLAAGFKVYLFGRMVVTPLVPYAIKHLKCLAGVMVTASHNPKQDNGYKVYWTNGTQIISPVDRGIQNAIMLNLVPRATSWQTDAIGTHALLYDPYENVVPAYYADLLSMIPAAHLASNESNDLRFVYTAMHGVGYAYIEQAFRCAKLPPVVAVPEQREPDPEFSTVEYPNPEEGKCSLDLAIQLANREGLDIIIANDPDADRLAVAVRKTATEWKILNGNELGALMGWWAMENYRTRTGASDLCNCVMISSTVSSKILSSMAAVEGFEFEETLTGFKWMGNKALELAKQGKTVLLAFEEAIGYMFSMNVTDKDGISAATQLATMACYLRSTRQVTLLDKLQEIYQTYGYHITNNSYYICHDPTTIKNLFERLRTFDNGQSGTYPKSILNGEHKIQSVRDLTTGYDSTFPDRKARLPVSSSSQMITFTFDNGMVITLRTSGTEPKIKYYAEMCGLPEEKDWQKLEEDLARMVKAIIEEFLQPEINHLQAKKEQ